MTDLGKIFNKHPEELTDADLDQIVEAYKEHMRMLRINGPKAFNQKTGEPKKVRRRKAKADPRQIDLAELMKETGK